MRQYINVFTADNADALNNTNLESCAPGTVAAVYIASTQNDSVLILTAPGSEAPAVKTKIPLRTNGMPLESDDPGYIVPMPLGGKLGVDIDIVTAATVGLIVKELP